VPEPVDQSDQYPIKICARIDAKSLIFGEKYNMSPALKWPSCAAVAAGFTVLFLALSPLPVTHAQTTVLPPAQKPNDFQEASVLYRKGEYDSALERTDAWLKSRPKDARGRFLRGMILTQQKKSDDAVRVYAELMQDFPELPEPYNNLAVIYAERGDLDKARNLLESAIRANARFSAAHENLGDIHTRLAAAAYEQALKLDAANKNIAAKLKAVNDLMPARAPAAGKP
jgi:tetratricopeptide (TPR) repeat protein